MTESEQAKERNAEAFTQRVLDLRDKYTRIISEAFSSDRLFLQALNASFEVRVWECVGRADRDVRAFANVCLLRGHFVHSVCLASAG